LIVNSERLEQSKIHTNFGGLVVETLTF